VRGKAILQPVIVPDPRTNRPCKKPACNRDWWEGATWDDGCHNREFSKYSAVVDLDGGEKSRSLGERGSL